MGHEVCGTVLRDVDRQEAAQELKRVPMMLADLRYSTSFTGPLTTWKPDCVVHLAAQSSGSLAVKDPAGTYRINVIGTLNTLEAIRKTGWGGTFLMVSSGEVYGSVRSSKPLREDAPIAPVNHYAASKAMAEMLAAEYQRMHGVKVIITRAFPHTGPGQSRLFALSSFAQQIALAERAGGGVLRVGNLDACRDYLDVRDVASAYGRVLEKGTAGEIYNVASGKSYRIGDLLDILVEKSTSPITVEKDHRRLRKRDIEHLIGDSGKLEIKTGWAPAFDISATLTDLLEYWRERC
jgi:GDP-4-dehydro-6-deoxy-D-mannose reductase